MSVMDAGAGGQVRVLGPALDLGGNSTLTREECKNWAQMSYENWLVTTATINSCDWEGPQSQIPGSLFIGHFTVVCSYAVDGSRYKGRFHSSHAWEKGAEVGFLYNPTNPAESSFCDEEDDSRIVPILECALELLSGLF